MRLQRREGEIDNSSEAGCSNQYKGDKRRVDGSGNRNVWFYNNNDNTGWRRSDRQMSGWKEGGREVKVIS